MINTQKSILAKLLATENIEVVHGQFKTAFFDVEKRVLGLPLWTQLENVYDLLVGHEVGHALFTPAEGWHDADIEIPGCPRSFLNVVEDIRIEKLIQRKYPGLVSCFKRGYQKLDDEDFFGTSQFEQLSPEFVGLIDRINLKAKLRDLVEVEFSAEEQPLVKEAFAVETWEDVLAICKKLYEHAKENAVSTSPSMSNDNQEEGDADEADTSNSSQDSTDMESSHDQTTDSESGSETAEEEVANNEEESDVKDTEGGNDANIESQTDKAYRENEHKLIETNGGRNLITANGFTQQQIQEMIVPYAEIKKAREAMDYEDTENFKEAYDAFLNDNKKVVQVMAKEFEMRKAAWRTKRASTARSGSLDVNKLYSYKYTDDIFKRMVNMPDAKNHGLFMMIDYSGSMQNILEDVIKQVLVLTMFCKKVNIPFQVWGFTTDSRDTTQKSDAPYSHVDHQDVKLMQLLSSAIPKHEQENAFKRLFGTSWYINQGMYYRALTKAEWLGGTPLDEMLMAVPSLIQKFTKQNNIQKTNFVLLSDGFGSHIDIVRHENT